MTDEDDLTRGRLPSPPTGSNGAVGYVDTIVGDHDRQFREITTKMQTMDGERSAIRLDLDVRTRNIGARIDTVRTQLLDAQRQIGMLKMWLWFLGIIALVDGISTTVQWIVMGAR